MSPATTASIWLRVITGSSGTRADPAIRLPPARPPSGRDVPLRDLRFRLRNGHCRRLIPQPGAPESLGRGLAEFSRVLLGEAPQVRETTVERHHRHRGSGPGHLEPSPGSPEPNAPEHRHRRHPVVTQERAMEGAAAHAQFGCESRHGPGVSKMTGQQVPTSLRWHHVRTGRTHHAGQTQPTPTQDPRVAHIGILPFGEGSALLLWRRVTCQWRTGAGTPPDAMRQSANQTGGPGRGVRRCARDRPSSGPPASPWPSPGAA